MTTGGGSGAVPRRGERGRGGAPFPDGVQVSLGLLAGFRAERAHLLRAHLRGVPQGQVLHHRARAPRHCGVSEDLVAVSETVFFFPFFPLFFQTVPTVYIFMETSPHTKHGFFLTPEVFLGTPTRAHRKARRRRQRDAR
jgi:hypothetical protein